MVLMISFTFQKSDLMGKVVTSRVSDRFANVQQSMVLLHSVDAYKRVKDDILSNI